MAANPRARSGAIRLAEFRSRAMTRIANRTFTTNPGRLDRAAQRLIEKAAGPPAPHDPELDHEPVDWSEWTSQVSRDRPPRAHEHVDARPPRSR